MSSPIEVCSDLSEHLNYNLSDFPLYVHRDHLYRYGYAASCHWHIDLEFINIIDGSMDFFINGKIAHLDSNSGIFVNSKRLHYGFSNQKDDCNFIALIINPILFYGSSYASKKYFDEKFGLNTDDYILLDSRIDWQKESLKQITKIYELMQCKKYNPLQVLSQAASLCAQMGGYVQDVSDTHEDGHLQISIWEMTGYIHQHYDKKITLDDIAASGAVCRSKCCELFKKYVEQTPNNYLNRYRISKGSEMLKDTNRTISEIAIMCGFQSSSYFSNVFRKATGLTPNDYRNQFIAF